MDYDDNFEEDPHAGGIDADAVCEKCSTVNPEETLLCKGCGNNLREQRAQRIATQTAEIEFGGEGGLHRSWLRKGFVLIGILLILCVIINVGSIESWLVRKQTVSAANPKVFWKGTSGDLYDGMLEKLRARSFSEEEIATAIENSSDYQFVAEGFYYLTEEGIEDFGGRAARYRTGRALLSSDGDRAIFVALLGRGIEARGSAQVDAVTGKLTSDYTAAVKIGREYNAAFGVVMLTNKSGGLDCYGQADTYDQTFTMVAYLVE